MSARVASLRACCLLLCIVAGTQQLNITEFSVPTGAEAGENVKLQCKYQLEEGENDKLLYVKWWWIQSDTNQTSLLYQRINGQPSSVVKKNIKIIDNDDITLLGVDSLDSGIYECEVTNDIDEKRSRETLIVFASGDGPNVNYTYVEDGADANEDRDILITCDASDFSPQPDLSITIDGEELTITETVAGPTNGLYNISANATISALPNGAEIQCELFFHNGKIIHPAYIDKQTYEAAGEAYTTTESPDDTTETQAESDSLQNTRDSGSLVSSSRILFISAALTLCLITIL